MTTVSSEPRAPMHETAEAARRARQRSVWDPAIVRRAILESFIKLDPRYMISKPVMFIVEIGAAWVTILFFTTVASSNTTDNVFDVLVILFLWFTVLFGTFADAMAEGRGRAQAASLRATRQETMAHVLQPDGSTREVPSVKLRVGDRAVVAAGQLIPGDGDVVEGMALVDESAITGESAPVIRESGGDRSAVTGSTRVLSDRIVVQITAEPGQTFLDRMIALVEGSDRRRTPNERALQVVLVSLTLVFIIAVSTFQPFAIYSHAHQQILLLVALLVLLSPTTIGALLAAIGIAGMDRMVRRNVLAMSGRAVEAAGDVTVLLLDKTGTITFGNRMAAELIPVGGTDPQRLAEAALLASVADETPEGRSIVTLAGDQYGLQPRRTDGAELVPFTAQTRMSGIEWDGRSIPAMPIAASSAPIVVGDSSTSSATSRRICWWAWE